MFKNAGLRFPRKPTVRQTCVWEIDCWELQIDTCRGAMEAGLGTGRRLTVMQSQQRPGQIPWRLWDQDGPSTSSSLEAGKPDFCNLTRNQFYSGCPRGETWLWARWSLWLRVVFRPRISWEPSAFNTSSNRENEYLCPKEVAELHTNVHFSSQRTALFETQECLTSKKPFPPNLTPMLLTE